MKKLFTILLFIFIGHHFLVTALYLGPKNPYSIDYQKYVNGYMEPLFTQNWALFAPEPATNELKLWYKCKLDNKDEKWLDALSSLQRQHQDNRFTFKGKLSFIYTSLIRSLYNDTLKTQAKCTKSKCSDEEQNKKIKELSYYKSTKRLVSDLCKSHGKEISMFNIVIHSPKEFSERNNKNAKGKISFLSYR